MIEFEYSLEFEGHFVHVLVQAEGNVYGHNYGEDADGNRGEWRIECDDLAITVLDGHGKDITKKLKEKYPWLHSRLETLADDLLISAYNEGPEYDPE